MLNLKNRNDPILALSCLWQGVKLLNHPQLRKYLLIPLFINVILYTGAFIVGYHSVSALLHQFIPDWLAWLSWVLWPLFFVSFLLVSFFTFTLVANLIAAPYYSELSAKVLRVILGQEPAIVEQPWGKIVVGELRRIGYLLLRILPLMLLFLIPVVNLVAPILWAFFSAWGLAMEYLAYPLENRGLTFTAQKQFLQQSRLGILCFGGATSLALTLPLINLLVGQAAVIGATLYVHHLSENSNPLSEPKESA